MIKDEVKILRGTKSGPKSAVVVGVHGNEPCGPRALEKILPKLQLERGTVVFIYGNPEALKNNVRFMQENLNRMFQDKMKLSTEAKESYEYKRAQSIKEYLQDVDATLDVHASATPDSPPFVINEGVGKDIAQYLPVRFTVSGFDDVQPGGVDYYMNSQGKIGLCVECGFIGDKKSEEIAGESILAFLKSRGHIEGAAPPQQQLSIRVYYQYVTRTENFKLTQDFADFEKVEKGQIIGFDGNDEISAPKESYILFARNRNGINEEAFLLGESTSSS